MRLLYDGYIFRAQRTGGISRYFTSLISRLPEDWTPIVELGGRPEALPLSHPRLQLREFPLDSIRPRRLYRELGRRFFRCYTALSCHDVFHPTFHFLLPEEFISQHRRPMVLTIHDMIPEIFAAQLDPDGVEALAKGKALEAADAIICNSENTKRDLQEWHKIPDARITVTPLASDLKWEMAFGEEEVPPSPYVLYMGNRGTYKNFARVLQAFARARDSWPAPALCVVGHAFNDEEKRLVESLRLRDAIIHLEIVSDRRLAKLYRCSEALLYPSLYEGFGIPPLEAMTCGTVVIASNTSSLPEVVGDAAISVKPESVEEIAEAILSLRSLGPERDTLIERGFERARGFDWDDTARKTVEVYKSLAA